MMDYEKYLNKTIREIPLSPIEKVSLLAKEAGDCIVLGVGEPDFKTPWRIREAGIQALEKGKTWYSPGLGLQPLKKAICEYQRRRFLINELNSIGLPCYNAQGAFYVFADVRGTGMTSEEFCERLIRHSRVAVIPGNAFGAAGEGFVRISYSYSLDHLMEATKRIGEFLQELKENK